MLFDGFLNNIGLYFCFSLFYLSRLKTDQVLHGQKINMY